MEKHILKGAIEALIFSSELPLKIEKIVEILSIEYNCEIDKKETLSLLIEIADDFNSKERGFSLTEVAGGYQFRTKSNYATLLQKLKAKKPPKFGRAAMEVLAIIAYRQPATRAEVEDLRGVDSGGIVRSLLEKRLVKILGKKDIPGKPIIYGTTKNFLQVFNLRDLSQLPALKEFVELEELDEMKFSKSISDLQVEKKKSNDEEKQ